MGRTDYSNTEGVICVNIYDNTSNEISGLVVYPNPCSSATRIRFTIDDQRFANCDLFKIDGSMIEGLLNEEMMPGSHEVEVDLSGQPAGIYFIRIQAGDDVFTRKLVKIND